jgi:hypothetical protein
MMESRPDLGYWLRVHPQHPETPTSEKNKPLKVHEWGLWLPQHNDWEGWSLPFLFCLCDTLALIGKVGHWLFLFFCLCDVLSCEKRSVQRTRIARRSGHVHIARNNISTQAVWVRWHL